MESQKPARDERSWVIGMAEVGFNTNYDAFHFDIHKTIAYRIINRFVQTKLGWDRPRSGRQTPLEERFIEIISRRDAFFTSNTLCITSGTVSGTWVSTKTLRNRLRITWRMFKMLTFCPFQKHFMTCTALHTNDIFQYFVLDKIVIAFTSKKYLFQFVLFQRGFL